MTLNRRSIFDVIVDDGWLASILVLLMAVELAFWVPHYLTWPYWADHDVFATAARGWFDGRLPYRDAPCNNFPGTIYLFAALGFVFGWGRPEVFQACDAGLLIAFLTVMAVWTRRVYGSVLPGLIAGLGLIGHQLALDYAHSGQRDWHTPAFVAIALFLVQLGRSKWLSIAAGLACAIGLSLRPQAVLLIPAVFLGAWFPPIALEDGKRSRFLILAGSMMIGLLLVAVPLVWFGILDDFLSSLKVVSRGGGYNRMTWKTTLVVWLLNIADVRWWAVFAAAICLVRHDCHLKRIGTPWWVMLLGCSLYKPISPHLHTYLDIPLTVIGLVTLATLAGAFYVRRDFLPEMRFGTLLLTLGIGEATLHPKFCAVGPTLHAYSAYRHGFLPMEPPPGYRAGRVPTSAYYPWQDYRALLSYLRQTKPTTKIANMLKGDPAICAMVDRASAFPAEAIVWLRMVNREDEPRFAASLEASGESTLVIWVPNEPGPDPKFQMRRLEAVVRRDFEFERGFGAIEVWRRKTGPGKDSERVSKASLSS